MSSAAIAAGGIHAYTSRVLRVLCIIQVSLCDEYHTALAVLQSNRLLVILGGRHKADRGHDSGGRGQEAANRIFAVRRRLRRNGERIMERLAATVPDTASEEFLAALSGQKGSVLPSYIYT